MLVSKLDFQGTWAKYAALAEAGLTKCVNCGRLYLDDSGEWSLPCCGPCQDLAVSASKAYEDAQKLRFV